MPNPKFFPNLGKILIKSLMTYYSSEKLKSKSHHLPTRSLALLFPIFNCQCAMTDVRYKFPIVDPLNGYSINRNCCR